MPTVDSCWATALGECAGGISAEHIITGSLFLGDTIGVRGLSWCREEYKFIGKTSYTATILCRRHNSDLSPVDEAGRDAFNVLRIAQRVHEQRRVLRESGHWTGPFDLIEHAVNGAALERWFLKTLINFEVAGKQDLPVGSKCSGIDPDLVGIAFGRRSFDPRAGLYFAGYAGEPVKMEERVQYTSWISDQEDTKVVLAGAFLFFGFRFVLSLDPSGLPATVRMRGIEVHLIYHPTAIELQIDNTPSQRIVFAWPETASVFSRDEG